MTDPIIISTVKPRPFSYRGPSNSAPINDFQEEVAADILNLTNTVNSLNANLARVVVLLQNDNQYLRRKIDSLKQQQLYIEKISAVNNYLVSRMVDFSDTENISFPSLVSDEHSAMLNAEYGEITLPALSIENKFYSTSLRDGKIILPYDLDVTVKSTFDKGEGVVNYEKGGTVTEGNPEWAFNGINEKYWIRKVEFPIDSVVDEVECELTVSVPQGVSSKANTIDLNPFPNGSVDITELATASDLGNNFIRVTGFIPLDNMVSRRYHFPSTTVDQIRIRLRQRNWVEENGKKVFYYGLQELGLKLIDYDKTYIAGAAFGSNNSFVIAIKAPDNHVFTSIQRIDPDPNFLLEDPSLRHVHLKIGTQESLDSGLVYDSDINYTPQELDEPIVLSVDTLYAFFELNFVSSSGGLASPYTVDTTPYVKGLGLSYTLAKV